MGLQSNQQPPLDEEAAYTSLPTNKRWILARLRFPTRRRSTCMPSLLLVLLLVATFHLSFSFSSSTLSFSFPGSQMPFDDDSDIDRFPIVDATSHNDEMQQEPLTLALSLGIPCIEVDVWLVDGVLLAGHEQHDLAPNNTLHRLYLEPLLRLLSDANPEDADAKEDESGRAWNGVFARAPSQELTLMIDVKGDGEALWPALTAALEPFRQRSWLTTYAYAHPPSNSNISEFYDDGTGTLTPGPLRIVGTGNTPLWRVYTQAPDRDVFFDAPLLALHEPLLIPVPVPLSPSPSSPSSSSSALTLRAKWHPALAPLASAKWPLGAYLALLPRAREAALRDLRAHSAAAHALGLRARWWGAARWPPPLRRRLWAVQRREAGVDWVNADDLVDVARFLRGEMAREAREGRGRRRDGT